MAATKSKSRKTNRARNEALALSRRNANQVERAAKESARLAKVEARKAAIALYEAAFNAWCDAGEVGPAPLDPRYRDFTLFPENRPLALV